MFRKFHERLKDHEEGFTLIELLVVILIIAILAAIAIPVFLRQREKGWVGQNESALKDAQIAAESYATGPGNGSYVGMDESALQTEGYRTTADVDLTVVSPSASGYCLQAVHTSLVGAGHDSATMRLQATDTGSGAPENGAC